MKKSYGGVTTTYIFSGTKPIAEYVGGTVTREYIYSGETQLAEIAYSGLNVSVTYMYPDHLSTRDETDASGNLTRTFGHLPFGETWYETGTSSKWKFTTYERDSESNNDYATFRYYENRLGRFMTTDPLSASATTGMPQSWNRYAYALNDPVHLKDPLGLMGWHRAMRCNEEGCSGWNSAYDGMACYADGAPIDCELAYGSLAAGAAIECPYASCGPLSVDGQWLLFSAWADGSSGYLPFGLLGFSTSDIESLRLVPYKDCSRLGQRNIIYDVQGARSADPGGWYVTETQDPGYWAGPTGQTTYDYPGEFDDIIFGWKIENSLQTFTISRQNPRTHPGTPYVKITVRLGGNDYGTLGIWHGGMKGFTFVQGNSSGWAPCD